jgi:hypothetical protein
VNKRLDQLGAVAGIWREIGLAEWVDAQHASTHEQVSMGAATSDMILNTWGFSNR